MLKLKGCPRCGGDTVLERDQHGWYEECLQCGYHHDLKGIGQPASWGKVVKNA